MNVLTEALSRQAGMARPAADLPDVYRRVQRHRRLARRRRIVSASLAACGVIGVVAVVAAVGVRRGDDPDQVRPPITPAQEVSLADLGAVVITGTGADQSYAQSTLERSDPDAATGPYSLVVRTAGGSLLEGSAVVTYPDPNSGGVAVRGAGLTPEQLRAIEDATAVVAGRPVFSPTPETASFAVVAMGRQRPPAIHEVRLGCDSLGEGLVLGSFCYTGLTTSPGFEQAVYQAGYQPGPLVQGQPSVVSFVGGGNATLAWEPMPGVIAYVGYSGASAGEAQVAALGRLANRATLLSPAEWAATGPQVVEQSNEW